MAVKTPVPGPSRHAHGCANIQLVVDCGRDRKTENLRCPETNSSGCRGEENERVADRRHGGSNVDSLGCRRRQGIQFVWRDGLRERLCFDSRIHMTYWSGTAPAACG